MNATELTRVLEEVYTEQRRAIANGMAEHDSEHTREMWATKIAAAMGYVAHFRNQPVTYRIQLVQLASIVVAAMVAHDRAQSPPIRIDAELDR